jgi:PAS domain S-box-containing protein
MTLILKLKSIWNQIVNMGVYDEVRSRHTVRIMMTNRVYVLSSLFSIIYTFYLVYIGHVVPSLVVFGMASICALLLFANHFQLYTLGKIIYTAASNFCIYYFSSYLGKSSGVHLFVLLSPVIILSFFDFKEKKSIMIGMGIYILTFIMILEVENPIIHPSNILTQTQQDLFYMANVFFILILSTVLMIFLLKSNSEKNIELLKKQSVLMQSQRRLEEEIKEHKIAREKIKISEFRLATSLEAAQQGLWDLNLKKAELTHDKMWATIMGLNSPKENIIPLEVWLKIIQKDQLPYVEELIKEHFNGTLAFFEAEYQIQTESGEWRWIFSRGKVTEKDEHGNPLRMMGTIQDINIKKEFEKELQISKEAAVQASFAKAQFLSIMSHEIRTPLNAVIGATYLLQKNPREDQIQNIEILKISSQNLLILINNILDFNKIEANKIDFEETDFNVKNLINNLTLPFYPQAKEKGISLYTTFDGEIPDLIISDPNRIAQILTNLLSNAIKFTDKGEVTMECKVIRKNDSDIILKFSVTDTGIGISPENCKVIFDPFAQGNSSITRKYGGTGLGLSISQKLLHLLGSEIFVESKLGKGAKFHFTLKFRIAPSKFLPSESVEGQNQKLKGLNILLVEDNEMNQLFTKKILENLELNIDIASNGLIALEKVKLGRYDVILMDLQMPHMDGFQATMEIRKLADPKFKIIPIIALTAEAFLETKDKAFDCGITDYITKPFSPQKLYDKIFKHISKEKEFIN